MDCIKNLLIEWVFCVFKLLINFELIDLLKFFNEFNLVR